MSTHLKRMILVMATAVLPGLLKAQCVATFTNASGNGRWDNNANWTITAKPGGTGCSYGTIGALMTEMVRSGAGYSGHEVIIDAPVANNTGQPWFPVFDNLTITANGSFQSGGNAGTYMSIRRTGTLRVDGVLTVPGTLQLNFAFGGEPVLPTSTQLVVSAGASVNVGASFSLQNAICGDNTRVIVNGTMAVGDDMYGNQNCPSGERPISGTGSFILAGGCNSSTNTDRNACPNFCAEGKCPAGGLPVELIAFGAEAEATYVRLNWATATELNNSHFVLSRSTSQQAFLPIARIEGNGTSQQLHSYSYDDLDAEPGMVYYMLEQYDYDGTRTLLGVREVMVGTKQQVTISPNPVAAGASIRGKVTAADGNSGRVELLSSNGRLLDSTTVTDGAFVLRGQANPGAYFVRVTMESGRVFSSTVLVQ